MCDCSNCEGCETKEGMFLDITSELLDLYLKKNKDYGNAFGDTFKEFGLVSAVIRINDKVNRLKKLTSTGSQEVKDESIRDTLVDLSNYAIMTIMELDKNE